MLIIAIKDLEVRFSNLNLPIGKSAIWFGPLVQKGKTGEQIAHAIYFFYLSANNFTGAYARLRKTWAKTPLLRQDRIVTILRKWVLKQAVRGEKGKSEIATIPNKYKDTPDDLIDSSDIEFLEILRSKSVSIGGRPDVERDNLDKDGKDQSDKEGRQGGKKTRVVREDSSSKASICDQ